MYFVNSDMDLEVGKIYLGFAAVCLVRAQLKKWIVGL